MLLLKQATIIAAYSATNNSIAGTDYIINESIDMVKTISRYKEHEKARSNYFLLYGVLLVEGEAYPKF